MLWRVNVHQSQREAAFPPSFRAKKAEEFEINETLKKTILARITEKGGRECTLHRARLSFHVHPLGRRRPRLAAGNPNPKA